MEVAVADSLKYGPAILCAGPWMRRIETRPFLANQDIFVKNNMETEKNASI